MPSYKFTLAYEGTAYCGWQKNGDQPTIELAIEKAFYQIRLPHLKIEGSSRTDAGVHAKEQIARVDLEKPLRDLRLTLVSLNSQLPEDIRILKITPCNPSFHPTLDAQSKTYEYFICTGPAQIPIYRHFSWHIPKTLNIELMQKAIPFLLGTHDFEALTNIKKLETYKHHIRTILNLSVEPLDDARIKIRVRGNQFLYKMVRNLVGLLVAVADETLAPENINRILLSKDRRLAPMTAPAHGLVLHSIDYGQEPVA